MLTHGLGEIPAPRKTVEQFADACLAGAAARSLRPDTQHWSLSRELCERADCRSNRVQDAYLAALALAHNCTYVTTDRDFSRFPRLRWQHPLDAATIRAGLSGVP